MVASGRPSTADCGYTPRSAASMLCGSKSLPTIWIDNPVLKFAEPDVVPPVSAMPPLRAAADFPFPLALPLFEPFPLFAELAPLRLKASQTAMAMEYVSSPVAQPALQMRSGLGPSTDLRAQSTGTTCRVKALSAPG